MIFLNQLSLKFGSSNGSLPLSFAPGNITIFVGPNNSGKSLVLREIERYFQIGGGLLVGKIVESISFELPESIGLLKEMVIEYLGRGKVNQADSSLHDLHKRNLVDERANSYALPIDLNYIEILNSPDFRRQFIDLFTLRLDGITRLEIVQPRLSADLQEEPKNLLVALLKSPENLNRIREVVHQAFDRYLAVDPTGMQTLRLRLMKDLPPKELEFSVSPEATKFYGRGPEISEFGDGVKAFVGLLIAMTVGEAKIFLIDEPEAFLHPPLAQQLGSYMATLSIERNLNLFASTHSAHLIMGCLQSGSPINIVRLTFKGGRPTARLLNSSEVKQMFQDPIMRSSGIIDALFHESAIVSEDDSDRVFYKEINDRLSANGRQGVKECAFINSIGKSNMYKIIGPLRKAGIPIVAIPDFDLLLESKAFGTILEAALLPESYKQNLKNMRGGLYERVQNKRPDLVATMRRGGLGVLEGTEFYSDFREIIDGLAQYGVFVVPNGALESWLPGLGVRAEKRSWLYQILEKLGSDPQDMSYVQPQAGDVWAFIEKIASWVGDPNRKGMPE